LDRRIILILGFFILGVIVFGVDFWANISYPTGDFQVKKPIQTEKFTGTWEYFKDNIGVGTYSSSISKNEDSSYQISSTTEVTYQGISLQLESHFKFDDFIRPINYTLVAIQENEETLIKTTFEGNRAITVVDSQGERTIIEEAITEETFLIDKTMPGQWELLLSSSNIERGKKYDISIFMPQINSNILARILVEKSTKQIKIEDNTLDCTIVQIDLFELTLFFFEGHLVRYQNDKENLVLNKKIEIK
jgi:hypothetical protein